MPTYEYECLKCKKRFDFFQSMTDDPVENCPECNGMVRRLISAGAGIIFKGSGFYVNDYKNTSTSPDNGKSSDSNKVKKDEAKKVEGKKETSSSNSSDNACST